MRKLRLIIIAVLAFQLWIQSANAQIIASKEEREALKMVSEVSKLMKEGKDVEAEKLLLEANEVYPLPYNLGGLAEKKAKEGDLNGANKLWDIAFIRLKKYGLTNKNFNRLLIKDTYINMYVNSMQMNSTYNNAAMVIKIAKNYLSEPFVKSNYYTDAILNMAALSSFTLEDVESMKYFYNAAVLHKSEREIFTLNVYLLIADKKYDEAISILNVAADKGAGFLY
ncbi:MAG: hypothetical protein EOO89_19625, partial [Pedobacter sp.]